MLFALKLIASFIVGGAYVTLTTRVAERVGPRVGGLLAGLPSTIFVSLFFIAIATSDKSAAVAARVVSGVIAAALLFLITFIYMSKKGTLVAVTSGVLVWFITALPILWLRNMPLFVNALIGIAGFLLALAFFHNVPTHAIAKHSVTRGELVIRAIFAGSIICLAVFLSKVSGPRLGGVLGAFPATFASTLVILTNKHGADYAKTVAKSMPFGSLGTMAYVIVFSQVVVHTGLMLGMVIGYGVAVIVALASLYMRNKLIPQNISENELLIE